MCHFVMVDFIKDINIIKHNFLYNAFVMSVFLALFYMLQVEVHLRMREIRQQICATQKTIILMRNIQSIFFFSL